jgi:hypothetical protein
MSRSLGSRKGMWVGRTPRSSIGLAMMVALVFGVLLCSGVTTAQTAPFAPANDDFAASRLISSGAGWVSGTIEGATRQAGEPDHYTSNPNDADDWLGDHTVWYSWKAPDSGPATIDTCLADIDSVLAVYTGSALNTLNRVADNNNDHAYCPSESWGSKVTFNATAGTTYRIAVGDAGGLRENTFTLKLSSAPRDTRAPKVSSTSPASNATGVGPAANISATFSEAMRTSSINSTTVKLSKAGNTTAIGAVVSYDPTTKKATLNPNANLRRGAKYKAVVTTGAKDLAGNRLDQNTSQSGLQQRSWTFTTRNLSSEAKEFGVGVCSRERPRPFLFLLLFTPSAKKVDPPKCIPEAC